MVLTNSSDIKWLHKNDSDSDQSHLEWFQQLLEPLNIKLVIIIIGLKND